MRFGSTACNVEVVFVPLTPGFIVAGVKDQATIVAVILGVITARRIGGINADVEEAIIVGEIDIGMDWILDKELRVCPFPRAELAIDGWRNEFEVAVYARRRGCRRRCGRRRRRWCSYGPIWVMVPLTGVAWISSMLVLARARMVSSSVVTPSARQQNSRSAIFMSPVGPGICLLDWVILT